MSLPVNPIKRNTALVPLSRDHHEGLLFSWKIKQGIQKEIAPKRIAQYCSWFCQTHFSEHFKIEEQEFIPILSPRIR